MAGRWTHGMEPGEATVEGYEMLRRILEADGPSVPSLEWLLDRVEARDRDGGRS